MTFLVLQALSTCHFYSRAGSLVARWGQRKIFALKLQGRVKTPLTNHTSSLSRSNQRLFHHRICAIKPRMSLHTPRSFFVLLTTGGSALYFSRKYASKWKYNALCEEMKSVNQPFERSKKQQFVLWTCIYNVYLVIRIIIRACRLFFTFTPLLLIYPFTLISTKLKSLWWQMLLIAVEFSGPAFVKLGQWASTRRDLFSKEFCDRFSKLHRHAKTHSWKHTATSLERAYGPHWRNMILFDNKAQPIGSGCVAQVYKAFIRGDKLRALDLEKIQEDIHEQDVVDDILSEQRTFAVGVEIEHLTQAFRKQIKRNASDEHSELYIEPGVLADDFSDDCLLPVAIKVLHPDVHVVYGRDLALMKVMASCMEFVFPSLRWISLTECVAEFAQSMKKQMNMRHEARCLDRLAQDFLHQEHIRVPCPLWPLVTKNILVETFEETIDLRLSSVSRTPSEQDTKIGGLRKRLAQLGVDALLQMVFVNNFVHGDLHPGNILVQNAKDFKQQEDNQLVVVNVGDTVVTGLVQTDCPVKLVFLDCGITTSLSKDDRLKFREVFTAVVKGEGEVVADLFLNKTAHVECSDPEAFRQDMAAVVMQARQATLSLSQIHVAELLSEVFRILRIHRMKLESNFANVILAIAVLEGLGRSLDPHLDILEKARPILIHHSLF
ncbi:uncharacterized aarF domain-containing protein kinase 2-like [Haliotis rubra]|uniref:uncharacterized aarF domain-containing protein kinase 2-like n=1 Tax=Haliotis rubra TaxID=36100 RepID=UPI001EE517A9|nr:uncharacterized aarF domain-containing protein kinase 2-like [Haliotis rubra]